MNGFEKRAQRIKDKILNATMELLRTVGPRGLRIVDIAKAAKVSQVTIYNYFGSKEELLHEVLRTYADLATGEFERYLNEGHSFKETIEHIFALQRKHYQLLPPRVLRELLSEYHEMAKLMEEQYKQRTIPMTVRIFQEAKNNGEISEDVSIENVLALLQVFMNQFETLLELAQQSGDMDKFLDGLVHLFFYGICGKP